MTVPCVCRVAPPVAWRRPHGPVRAQLRHTVLQVAASLRRRHEFVIQAAPSVVGSLPRYLRYPSRFVTVPDLRVSAVSPHEGSAPRLPLPHSQALPGSIRLLSLRYYEAATTTWRFSSPPFVGWGPIPRADFPLRSYPPGNRGRVGQGVLGRLTPCRYLSEDAYGSRKFPGNPTASLPCSQTPVGPPRQALAACRCSPRPWENEGTGIEEIFEAQSHGFNARCLRFVPPF